MKRAFRIVFILYLFTITKLVAQGWGIVNPIFEPSIEFKSRFGAFADENNGWWNMGYAGSIWHSNNKGNTWVQQTEIWDSFDIYCMHFVDAKHGWVTGRVFAQESYYAMMITKDGGTTWTIYDSPCFTSITFLDSLNGFAASDSVYRTTDGGVSWKSQYIDKEYSYYSSINDIYFINGKTGWAAGYNALGIVPSNMIFCTTDSGKTWLHSGPIDVWIGKAIYFCDSLHGCAAGDNVIQTTTDGGQNWIVNSLKDCSINDICLLNDGTGWVIGNRGFLGYTSDYGVNWIAIPSGTTSDLYNIFLFNNGETDYILGNGILLKYDKTVDARMTGKSLPITLVLEQNYPNPFNPNTTIQYSIPVETMHASSAHVTLKIYDVLGREVVTLVNETKQPGNYEVKFDGTNLASGIYFYTLRAGDFLQTRKLILLK